MTRCRAHGACSVVTRLLPAVLLTASGVARADAVPPPPQNCPGNTIPTTSHGGPRCAAPPPEHCPPGHRGVIDNRCVLHYCSNDQNCGAGRKCREVPVCFVPHDEWVEDGRIPLDEPKTVYAGKYICKREGDCRWPSECRPTSLCFTAKEAVPTGPRRPPDGRESTAGDSRFAEPPPGDESDTPPPDDGPNGPQPSPGDPAPHGESERPSGCGKGCAATPSEHAPVGAVVLVALLLARRVGRRRQRC